MLNAEKGNSKSCGPNENYFPRPSKIKGGIYECHGMIESVKVHRKDQSVEDFTSKCLFLLFWPISCVSLISLIEIWSFCTNLLDNYPSHKISCPFLESSPCARISCSCLIFAWINSLYLFLLFLFMPLALFWPEWCKDPCLSLLIVYSCLNQA